MTKSRQHINAFSKRIQDIFTNSWHPFFDDFQAKANLLRRTQSLHSFDTTA